MFTVNLKSIVGFSTDEVKDVMDAISGWAAIWNGEQFEPAVLGFTYVDDAGIIRNSFYYTDGEPPFTNQEVYEKIIRSSSNGVCSFNLIKKFSWNIFSSAVAETDYLSQTVTIFSRYFNRASTGDLVNTLAHEAGCHCAGLQHTFYDSALRDQASVPYAIGDLTQKLFEQTQGK